MGIEHASMKSHISQEVRIQKLCTYPSGIEHAGTSLPFSPTYPMGIGYAGADPMQVKSCAHILRELNM